MFYGKCKIYPFFSSLKNATIFCGTNNLNQDSPGDIVDGIKIGHCFKEQHHHTVFICGLLYCDEYTTVNRVYMIETNKISKVKCLLKKFNFIDQDKYWTQLNGCLNSDMFFLTNYILWKKEIQSFLHSKYACATFPDFTKVPSSAIISNIAATYFCKYVCACKLVSVPMYTQSIRSPSYRVVKRCDFYLVS